MRSDIMNRFEVGPQILYGRGSIGCLIEKDFRNVMLVTEKFIVDSEISKKVTNILSLQGSDYNVFSEVKPDPTVDLVIKSLDMMVTERPDCIIALGGGSSIDTAKAMMYFFMKMDQNKEMKKPYFVAIPTTSGTGSEVTSYSVITDTKEGKKIAFDDPIMMPDLAIVDSKFTITVPKKVTADTGLDILTHSIEAFVSKKSNDYTDTLAEGAIKIVFSYLLKAFKDGKDEVAREKLHNASTMAGIAFNNSSLGINHSLAHALGARFHIPHGRANAMLMPHIIKYNSEEKQARSRYAYITKSIGIEVPDERNSVNALVKAVEILNEKLEIPHSLKDMGIEREEFYSAIDEMVDKAMNDICTENNPRIPSRTDFIKIYEDLYNGKK
ncbi:iron-containing alcohol dehydrogenase [Senegalia massiliensis]|uniref:Iron-containing alcohol dehydrogenase n=2 Tax=Senegalia massiliensis TaxID=1720316 RepID=A0A845QYC7_9CLOT|nr:iron-containing alcohol dehydrogenase [Senegalia massiliensis]